MRAKPEERNLADFLLQTGNGEYPSANCMNVQAVDLPPSIIAENDIVTEIYGEQLKSCTDISRISNVAILASKDDHCNDINAKVLNLPGKYTT